MQLEIEVEDDESGINLRRTASKDPPVPQLDTKKRNAFQQFVLTFQPNLNRQKTKERKKDSKAGLVPLKRRSRL
jgi:hypothetical protein